MVKTSKVDEPKVTFRRFRYRVLGGFVDPIVYARRHGRLFGCRFFACIWPRNRFRRALLPRSGVINARFVADNRGRRRTALPGGCSGSERRGRSTCRRATRQRGVRIAAVWIGARAAAGQRVSRALVGRAVRPSVGQYARSIRDPANDWPVAGTARCGRYRLNAMSLALSSTAIDNSGNSNSNSDNTDDSENDNGGRHCRGDRWRRLLRRHRWRPPATLQPLLLLLSAAGCMCNPDAKRLYDDLLSNYNRLIRPVSNNTDTVLVKLGLRLSQLIELVRIAPSSPPTAITIPPGRLSVRTQSPIYVGTRFESGGLFADNPFCLGQIAIFVTN